ncbi:hypothetical protein [Natronolimnohabitans innermongolicus]|uniref:Uncharacterized protein n=1 Tax=Natronolimnohabitans innermongolicus JCM 12255 TaxID=1227499 RepID=L9XHA7_9EURY|nr:hypothetical protein [Natronolimnohabitans innermongolicus]ELY61124.1 hypothetical protein C493_03360 [Natronolimnohabitans innermongolicus JCM 12255]
MSSQHQHNRDVVELFLNIVADGEASDPVQYLPAARANKIGYPYLKYLESEGFGTESVREELWAEDRQFDAFERDLGFVDSRLSELGIDYAIIKTRFPFEYRSWDLNLLVNPKSRGEAISAFLEDGWYRTTLREHPIARTEPGKFMLEHADRHPIHVHDSVSWNGFTYVPASLVLEHTRRIDGVQYPIEQLDWLIHCAHSAFENYELTLGEAYLLETFSEVRDRDLLEALRLLEAVELVTETADGICTEESRVELPVEYSHRDLFRVWRSHASGVTGGPELLSHYAQYGLQVVK